jgi:hypothetical protein
VLGGRQAAAWVETPLQSARELRAAVTGQVGQHVVVRLGHVADIHRAWPLVSNVSTIQSGPPPK